jgi:hypothetical protein
MNSQAGSISYALVHLKAGHPSALQPLWARYHAQLVRRARRQLRQKRDDVALSDEDDIALSAFRSFYEGVKEGRYPELDDRDNLWRVLVHIAACKIVDKRRYETRGQRDRRRAQSLPSPNQQDHDSALLGLVIGDEPSPVLIATVTEE